MNQKHDDAFTVCPGCGLRLPAADGKADPRIHASAECQHLCHELAFYTLAHGDPFFIHQVAVDAYAAQHAGPASKPITVAFALIGLCLLLERGATGREAQLAHMRYARQSKDWPSFVPPKQRGDVTVADVLQAAPGEERDAALKEWAASVWAAWHKEHRTIAALIDRMVERS